MLSDGHVFCPKYSKLTHTLCSIILHNNELTYHPFFLPEVRSQFALWVVSSQHMLPTLLIVKSREPIYQSDQPSWVCEVIPIQARNLAELVNCRRAVNVPLLRKPTARELTY